MRGIATASIALLVLAACSTSAHAQYGAYRAPFGGSPYYAPRPIGSPYVGSPVAPPSYYAQPVTPFYPPNGFNNGGFNNGGFNNGGFNNGFYGSTAPIYQPSPMVPPSFNYPNGFGQALPPNYYGGFNGGFGAGFGPSTPYYPPVNNYSFYRGPGMYYR